jgi:nicotinamide mononucleotide transporter
LNGLNANFAGMDPTAMMQIGPIRASLTEMVAVAFGLASVWFMKKERVLAFPLGMVNVLIYVYIFFVTKLYANAAINGFFFVMSAYGWYNWTRKNSNEERIRITRCSPVEMVFNVVAIIVLFFIIRIVLVKYTESEAPAWDALTTATYMVAQWLLSRKKIGNWILWIGADTVMTVLCAWEGLWFTAFQYLVFTVIAVLGFREWREKMLSWSGK